MTTLGELLNLIRSTGINPEPTGDSPYTSENVTGGTDSPTAQFGIDDLSNQTKTTLGAYLSKTTLGEGTPAGSNAYPISPTIVERSIVDASTGNPAPLNKAHQSFNKTYEAPTFGPSTGIDEVANDTEATQQRELAFAILDQIGFFDSTEDIIDKNDQTSGHNLLNSSAVKEKISAVLTSNRFNAYSSDKPFEGGFDPAGLGNFKPNHDWFASDGTAQDHPQIEKLKQISEMIRKEGVRAREVFPDYGKGVLDSSAHTQQRADRQLGVKGNDRIAIDLEQWMGEKNENPEPNPQYSKYHNKIPGQEPLGPDNKFEDRGSPFNVVISIAGIEALKQLVQPGAKLLDQLASISWLQKLFEDDNDPSKPWTMAFGHKHSKGKRSYEARVDLDKLGEIMKPDLSVANNPGYKFLHAINMPIPKMTIRKLSSDLSWATFAVLGLTVLQQQIKNDPHSLGDINDHIKNTLAGLSPDNNFGLPYISEEMMLEMAAASAAAAGVGALSGGGLSGAATGAGNALTANTVFVNKLKDCYLVKFLRSMVLLAESAAAANPSQGGTYSFSGVGDLSYSPPHPATRLSGDMGRPGNPGLAARNLPSMMLLPKAFTVGMGRYKRSTEPLGKILGTNAETNLEYADLTNKSAQERLTAKGASEEAVKASALVNKLGHDPLQEDSTRFSSDLVKVMENALEAELLPFYFHDLRTNEIVAFHAFLNALSDSFSPSYNASSGFGRIEDVQIYQKTTRAINLDFTVLSVNSGDMKEMYYKLNKLISMVYPQFSRGTLLELEEEHGTTRFVQPFSQVTTATPVIRIRVGDLIKSNYSREAMSRLMGIDSLEYKLVESDGDGGLADATIARQAEIMELATELEEYFSVIPFNEDGTRSEEHGWPVGTIVMAQPSYSAIPVYDSETDEGRASRDSRFVQGPFGAKILKYHPVSNPVNGPGSDCFVEVEVYNSAQIPGWPETDHLAYDFKNTAKITKCLISYTDIDHWTTSHATMAFGLNPDIQQAQSLEDHGYKAPPAAQEETREKFHKLLFTDENPMFRSFETTMGRGLAGVITSLNFDWGLNSEIVWDLMNFGYKAPTGCKVSIAFTPIHDITPGLDHNGMLRAPVFNVAGSGPHPNEDPHNDYKGRAAGGGWTIQTESKIRETKVEPKAGKK